MGMFSGNFPQPTNNPDPSIDLPPVNAYSPVSEADDLWNWTKSKVSEFSDWFDSTFHVREDIIKAASALWSLLGYLFVAFVKGELAIEEEYIKIMAEGYSQIIPIAVQSESEIASIMLGLFNQAMQSAESEGLDFGSGPLAGPMQSFFNTMVLPFTLIQNTADPTQPGAGIANMQYLLRQALGLNMATWIVDNASDHLGLGWLKHLQPFLFTVDRSVNPANTVRIAMDSAYTYLVRAPMLRDLQRQYPIKTLGLTALAKLYARGAIDEQTYLDKCLDQGLDNQWAQQLVLESAKLLTESQIGDLLKHGYITQDDAITQLKWLGYPDWQANALLYWITHQRFFSIQERVGNEAVSAWKKGYISQAQLESLLQNLGFSNDEVSLLEIEGQFTKRKTLTYSQIRQLYEANLVDIDYVINFLTNEGYSPDDVRLLILLDFVKAEERSLRDAELTARIRVEAALAQEQAQVAKNRNLQELSQAKSALAAELNNTADQLGLLRSLPSVMQLLGIGLP